MNASAPSLAQQVTAAEIDHAAVRWCVLADAAQDRRLPHALGDELSASSLFGATWNSPLGRQSPWLIELPNPRDSVAAWAWMEREGPRNPAALIIMASAWPVADLCVHLKRLLDVRLPDDSEMVLAIWDPAILASLLGHTDDMTLHVPGPILDVEQRATLTSGIAAYWYWDRRGRLLHTALKFAQPSVRQPSLPWKLAQQQVDDIVEAAAPDQVLYHIRTNQPWLLESTDQRDQYLMVQAHVRAAREHGMSTFRDLTNFCCAALIYGERWHADEAVLRVLGRLKAGEAPWDQLLSEFPP